MAKEVSRFSSTISNFTNAQNQEPGDDILTQKEIAANAASNRPDEVEYEKDSDVGFLQTSQQLANQQTLFQTPTVMGIGNLPGPKKMGESKYDFGLRAEDALDIDEVRGQRQTNWDKFGNGVIKNLLGKTTTNVIGGIVGTVYGLGSALINLDFDKMYDNEFARMLDDVNESMDGALPHYYTQQEMKEDKLLKRLGSANFLYDQVTNGFSFLAGAVITEMIAAAAIPFTGGSSLAANHVRLVGQAARQLKHLDRVRRMTTLASRYSKAKRGKAAWNTLRIGRQILTGANYEAGIEARAHYDEMMAGLIDDWKAQPENQGKEIDQGTLDTFEITARKTTNAVYGVNLALVGGSNMLMLPQLYGPGLALKQSAFSAANRLGIGLGRQTGKVVGKNVGRYASMGPLANWLGMGEKTQRVVGKTLNRIGLAKVPFYEGFVEEGLQSSINLAGYDYGMLTSSSESKRATADWLSSVYYGIHNTYANAEGQSEVALGVILGAIGLPGVSGGIRAEYKAMQAKENVQDLIAKRYNDNPGMVQSMKNSAKFFNEQQQLIRLMDQALMDKNDAAFKDLEHDYFFSYVKSRLEAGFFEDIIEDANAIKEMDNDAFIKFLGYNREDFSSEAEIETRKAEVAESAIKRATKIKESIQMANEALAGPGFDFSDTYTNDAWRKVRDRVAHQLTVADNVEERMDWMKGELAKLTGGRLVTQERTRTEVPLIGKVPYTRKTGYAVTTKGVTRVGTETLSPGIQFDTMSEKGTPTKTTIPFVNMTKPTLDALARNLEAMLSQDSALSEENEGKLSPEERGDMEVQLAVIKELLQDPGMSELTQEEYAFLDLALGKGSTNKALIDLAVEDPVEFNKSIEKIVNLLKDMRHLRARRQTAIDTYNKLMDPVNQQEYIQQLERFVDDNMKDDVSDQMERDGIDKEIADLFREYGSTTEFRPRIVLGTRGEEEFEEVESAYLKGKIVQFDEFGQLYSPESPGDIIHPNSLKGIGLDRITTQDQREAKKALQAIRNIRDNDKNKLVKVLENIKTVEEEVLQELTKLEDTYGTQEEVEEQLRTGRKKGKFISKAYLGDLKKVRDKIRDTWDTGEQLIQEYNTEARQLEESIEYLTELATLHFNPNTRTFDIDLDNRFIAERLKRIDLMTKEFGIPLDPENQEEVADLALAQEYVAEITSDLNNYIEQTDSNIEILSTRLGELKEYYDVIEKTLFERLRENKNLALNKHVMANNMNELYGSVLDQIENFVESEEGREDYMETRDEVLNPRESTVATMRTQLETLRQLPHYRAYQSFIKQNPDFFWELRNFLSELELVEKALDDMNFLKQETKSTAAEIAEIKEILDSIRKDRAKMDPEQQLARANQILEATKYEEAYNKILPMIAKMEAELLNPIIEGTDKASPKETKTRWNGEPIDGREAEFDTSYDANDKIYGTRYRRDWSNNPFNGTAGNYAVNKAYLIDPKLSTTESILEGNFKPAPGTDAMEHKRHLYGATWYHFTSNYFNYVKRKGSKQKVLGLMAIHSGNIPVGLEEEFEGLFVEKERTVDGADIKLMVVDMATLKPQKHNGRIIVTSMLLPNAQREGKEPYTRFTDNLSLTEEMKQEMVESHRNTRGDVLKTGEDHKTFDISGLNAGYSTRERGPDGKVLVFPVKNRLASTKKKMRTMQIIVPTKVDADGNSSISIAGVSYNARPGFSYAVESGNVHPLKSRVLVAEEVENLINLIRMQEIRISNAAVQGYEKRGEAFKFVQEEPLTDTNGTKLTDKTIYKVINDLVYTGKPVENAHPTAINYQLYFDSKRVGWVYGPNGFISSKEILDNDATAMEKFRKFLGTKTLHNNKATLNESHKKEKGKDVILPFEEIVIKDSEAGLVVDIDKSKLISKENAWGNYKEYLLSDEAAMGRSEAIPPPLRTSVPVKNNVVTDAQVSYRYVKYGLGAIKSKRAPTQGEWINPNPTPPSGVVYTEVQKSAISKTDAMLDLASKGQKIEIEHPATGAPFLSDPTPGRIFIGLGLEINGGVARTLGAKEDMTTAEAIKVVRTHLDKYKNDTYDMHFHQYLNDVGQGKAVTPLDPSKVKSTDDSATDQDVPAENKGEAIPEFTEEGTPVADFGKMIDEAMSAVDAMDPTEQIKTIEKRGEELGNKKEGDKISDQFEDLGIDDLHKTENDEDTAESLAKPENRPATKKERAFQVAEVKRMLPNIKIEAYTDYIKTVNGPAQGRVVEFGTIMLSNLAESGIAYHESWHQLTRYILPTNEAMELWDEVRSLKGELNTYKGDRKKFSELTNKEADEYLAEEFRLFALTNGAHEIGSTRIKSWFEKLLDLIDTIFFFGVAGEPGGLLSKYGGRGATIAETLTKGPLNLVKVAKVFNKLRGAYYADAIRSPHSIGGTAEALSMGATVRFDMDIISSLDNYLAKNLFTGKEGDLHLADLSLLGQKDFNKSFETKLSYAYLESIKMMLRDLSAIVKNDKVPVEAKAVAEKHITNIMGNLPMLVEMHRDHLNDVGLQFEVNYEDLAEDETARVKDAASDMFASMEFSTRDTAPSIVKFLISTLPSGVRNSTLLAGAVDFADTMNFIQDKLAGTQSLEEQVNILSQYKNTKPWVNELLKRLNLISGLDLSGSNYKDVLVQGAFFQQFAQQKNDFLTHIIDAEGNIYAVDTNKSRLNDTIVDPWRAKLLSDPTGIAKVEDGKIVIDTTKRIDIGLGIRGTLKDFHNNMALNKLVKGQAALNLLKKLGMTFTNEARLLSTEADLVEKGSNVDLLNETVGWVLKELNKPGSIKADIFDASNLDVAGRLGDLIQLEAMDNDTAIELQHFAPDGKVVYGITLNTYLSLVANSNGGTKGISNYLNPKTNLYTRNSRLVKSLEKGAVLRIVVQQGATIENSGDRGTTTTELSPADQRSGIVNATLSGIAPFLRAADIKLEYAIPMPGGALRLEQGEEILRGYLFDELAVAQSKKGREFAGFRDAEGLRFFKNIVKGIDNNILQYDLEHMGAKEFVTKHWIKSVFPAVEAYLEEQAQEALDDWIEHKLIKRQDNGQFKIFGLDKQLVRKITNVKDDVYSLSQMLKVAKVFSLNYMSNNIEQFKVFLGDPAFYKGLFKRTKMAVGTGNISRVDSYLDEWLNRDDNMRSDLKIADGTEQVMVFNDPVVISDYYDRYQQILGVNAAPYYNIMEGDAAALTTLDAYREFSIRTHDWSPVQEQLYWQIQTGAKPTLTKNEMAAFPIKKPQYMGPQVTTDGQFAPFGMKISLAPILPQMLVDPNTKEETQLNKLHDQMKEQKVGIMLYPSGTKFGNKVNSQTGEGTEFYAPDGTISDIDFDNVSTIDYKFFKKQVNISPKIKTYTTTGTQQRTLIKSDLFEGGVPVDYLIEALPDDRAMAWQNLSQKEKRDNSRVYDLIQQYDSLLNGITIKAKNNLLKDLNLEKVNDNYVVKNGDYAEFGKLIKRELNRRRIPRAIKDGVDYILELPRGEEKLFDALINKGRLENLLFSLISNRIIGQKMRGDMAVQATATGMEVTSRARKQRGRDSGKLLSGSEMTRLKFYEMEDWNDPKSKTLGMEVYLPHFFKEYFGENLIIRPDGIYDETGKKIGDSSLLDIIGFRIPTDGLHSIEFIKIKGFLSKDGGSQIIVPSELPGKTGSDFDIDKLVIYLPSYYRKKGVFTKRGMITASTETDTGLQQYYNAFYGPTLGYLKQLDRDLAEAKVGRGEDMFYDPDIDTLIKSIFGEGALEFTEAELDVLVDRFRALENATEERKLDFAIEQYEELVKRAKTIPSFEEFAEENRGKTSVELNHPGAVQNKLMDIQKEILENPRARFSLLNPISTTKLGYDDGIAGELRKLKGLSKRPDNIDYDEMISYVNVAKVMETFLVGKDNVGIEASQVTNHVKGQQAGLYIKPGQRIEQFGNFYSAAIRFKGFEDVMEGGAISLARIFSQDGEYISDTLSQMVNAFIDVSNDPFIFELNFNPRTSAAWNFLIRSGVPVADIAYFMNQPVILEYISTIANNSSKFLQARFQNESMSDIYDNLEAKIEKLIASQYKYHTAPDSSIEVRQMFDKDSLLPHVGKDIDIMDQDALKDQLQILKDYMMYSAVGSELTKLTQASAQDTKRLTSRAHAKVMEARYNEVVDSGIFGNFENMFKGTFLDEFRNTHFDTSQMFNSLFLTEQDTARMSLALNHITEVFTDPKAMKGVKNAERAIQKAENDAILYLFSDIEVDEKRLSDSINRMFTGPKSIPKQVQQFKAQGVNNLWIDKLVPLISTKQDGPLAETDNLKLMTRILNTYDQNLLLDSWHELHGNPATRIFAEELLDFALLQSGLNNSPISFVQYLPSDVYARRAMKIFNKFKTEGKLTQNASRADFFDKFFKNNWNDPNIVPRAKNMKFGRPSVVEGNPLGVYPYLSYAAISVSEEDADILKKQGLPVPRRIKLFKRGPKKAFKIKKKFGYDAKTQHSFAYIQVDKLGNGMQLSEYLHKDESSNFAFNDRGVAVATFESKNIAKELPITISLGLTEQIKKKRKTQIAAPKNKLRSGLYILGDGTRIVVEAVKPITLGELDTLGKKDNFARAEGYSNWDSLVRLVRKSNIMYKFLEGTEELNIFAIKEVRGAELATDAVENQKDATVVFNTTVTPMNLDGYGVDGPLTALIEERLSQAIDTQVEDGKRNFVIGMGHGTDLIAAQLLMKKQKQLAERNTKIRIVAMLPFQGVQNTFSDRDKAIFNQLVGKKYSTFTKNGNEVRMLNNFMPKNKEQATKLMLDRNDAMVRLGSTIIGVFGKQGGKMIDKAKKEGYKEDSIVQVDLAELKEITKIKQQFEEDSKPCN